MANVKISALPSIDATGLTINTVVASVDSGSTTTSKVSLGHLFQTDTSLVDDQNPGNYNLFIGGGSSTNSPSVGSEFRGSARNSLIIGNGVINNGNDNVVMSTVEAAGGNWTGIDGASVSVIGAAFRSRIQGGQECAILASQDATINNNYDSAIIGCAGMTINGSGPAFGAGCQGGTINGNRAVMLGSEGNTINSNMSGVYNSYATTLSGNLYQAALGTYAGTVNALGGAMENGIHIGSRDSVVDHQRASMISTSGRTSLYSGTSHHDGVHIYQGFTRSTSTGNTATGAVSIDLEQAGVYEFEMTGNITSLNFQNAREGGLYEFVVFNNGSFTITASGVTLGGVSNTVYAKGGALNPTNNQRTKYKLLIVNGKGYLNEELNFQVL